MARPEKHSLRVGVVGLGQAGGNLAWEFHRRGYAALAVNTAQVDLRALSGADGLPDEARLFVGVEGGDGAGKDPDFGRACLQDHEADILAAVTAGMDGVDLVLLCAGLGGGTGSCVADLWRLLEPAGLPLACVVTLPAAHESAVVKVNAVRAAEALTGAPLNARMVVDNARLHARFTDVDVLSFHTRANAAVVEPLDAFNRLGGRADIRSVRSFDGEDFRRILLSGGVLVPSVSTLPAGKPLSTDDLEKAVLSGLDGGGVYARGLVPQKVSQLAVVLLAPEEMLKELRSSAMDELETRLKARTGGGALSTGLYAARGAEATLMVMAASSALPASVEELLAAARKEGPLLSQKIHEELPRLDTSALEGVSLSRAPAPARLSRPPAPGASRPPPQRAPSAAPPPKSSPPPAASAADAASAPRPAGAPAPFVEPLFTDPGEAPSAVRRAPALPPRGQPTQLVEQEKLEAALAEPLPEDTAALAGVEGDDLQKFYDDLVEKFRATTDRRARERVGRRLMEDARSPDEDIRALAVWAMVAINDRGFRRALQVASKDTNAQVKDLALDGLKRLGDEAE